jgi:protein SCO1/2
MKKKFLIYGGLTVFVLTGFYLLIFYGTDLYKTKLPVISYVKPFQFVDQNGLNTTQQDVNGKVHIVEYFFTTCTGICPKMNTNMKEVYQKYGSNPDFMILSHTVDPETDSVDRLKRYADSLGANHKNWRFLTGRKDSLYFAARASYLLDDPENNNEAMAEQFIHTQFFALVDKQGRVRGIYDGLKKEELKKLERDVDDLLQESGGRFVNSLFGNSPK